MPTLAAVSADLIGRPCPVLCLDTCELLMAVQSLTQRRAWHVEALKRILDALRPNVDSLRVVITDLVPIEWHQNAADVQQVAAEFLKKADRDSKLIHEVTSNLGAPPASVPSNHAGTTLINELTALAEAVMAKATVLSRDSTCVQRALDRVVVKTRPSHGGHIKDSIHLEHYLELSRLLQMAGYTQRRVFVSSNRSDFWDGTSPRIHPSLAPDLAAVGLEFFGDLGAAVGSLGI